MNPQVAMLLAVLIPLAGGACILLLRADPDRREAATLVSAVLLFANVLALLPDALAGTRPRLLLGEPVPGVPLALALEPLGMLFALVASLLWIVTSVYSIGYMRGHHEEHQTRFYFCFALALAATMGIALSANLFTLFVFYELLTLSTYPLVTHAGSAEAHRAGRLYLGLLLGTSIGLLLFAIVWTWALAGTTEFTPGGILRERAGPGTVAVLLALYAFGIGKAALMPLHRWLPAAMVAPTPVSALLHAVAVVKAGVFAIVKVIVYVFSPGVLSAAGTAGWLVWVAAATIMLASLIALRQDNLKRRLAYSTISQLAYVVMAAALLAPLSLVASALHIAAHAFGKITLFFAAGSIAVASHRTEISQLDGIGRRMPWTMAAFTIGALSMIGVPPAAGFVSKWYLLLGTLQAEHLPALAVVILSTLLNAAYFLPIVYRAFFRDPPPGAAHGEAPLAVVAAVVTSAALTIALFLYPGPVLVLARMLDGGVP